MLLRMYIWLILSNGYFYLLYWLFLYVCVCLIVRQKTMSWDQWRQKMDNWTAFYCQEPSTIATNLLELYLKRLPNNVKTYIKVSVLRNIWNTQITLWSHLFFFAYPYSKGHRGAFRHFLLLYLSSYYSSTVETVVFCSLEAFLPSLFCKHSRVMPADDRNALWN